MAKMQRKLTGSEYGVTCVRLTKSLIQKYLDHVALVIRFNAELYFFDATGNNGVSLTSWQDFHQYDWQRYYKKYGINEKAFCLT